LRLRSAAFFAAAASPQQLLPPRLPEIALAGRSNVGKSSLLNRLVGRQALARVSKTPGRTQQINFFLIDDRWLLVDLPGYGFARVPGRVREQWRQVVEAYLERRRTLRGVIVIVDVRRGVEPDDTLLIDFLSRRRVPVQLAVTKIDKLARGERTRRLRQLIASHPDLNPIGCSAASGEGIADLARVVSRWLDPSSDE
jgi:GTP-binding protein